MRKLLPIFLAALSILSLSFAGLQPARALTTDTSWNPQSAYCTATVTTLETVIGTKTNSFGGATYAGGGFRPGIPDKRNVSPPCTAGVPANATFVEIDNVKIPFSVRESWDCNAGNTYCDQSFNIQDPNCPTATSNPYLCSIYTETDQNWEQFGVAPVNPPNGTLIDIQGFVFNETEKSVMAADHNYSPWEIHPLTAWRLAGQSTPDFALAPFHPRITIPQGNTGVATINVLGFNSFKGDVALTLQIPSGFTANLGSLLIHTVSFGQYSNKTLLTVTVPLSAKSGDYLLNVTGTSGLLSHTKTVTIEVPFFTMFSTPGSKTITPSSSFTSTITVLSESGFAGTVNLSGSASPSGISWQLNQTTLVVSAGGSKAALLTIDTHGTQAGLYNITIVGTSGSLNSRASVMVNVVDFSISASPSSLNFPSGLFGVTRVTISSIRSFAANVTMIASVTPTGPSATPFLHSLLLKANNFNSTQVRVDLAAPGSYILNITGTVGSLSHSTFVTFTVPSFAGSVIVGTDNALYWSSLSTGTWTSWTALGLTTQSNPAICTGGGGRIDLIARGANNVVNHTSYMGGVWSRWDSPGGSTRDQPACAVLNGLLVVVVRGMDNITWYDSMSIATGYWYGWQNLGGLTSSPPALVATATTTVQRVDLVVRGMDNGIYHKSFVNGVWSGWDGVGGATPVTPALVSDGSTLDMVVIGLDSTLYLNRLSFGGSWSGWSFVGGSSAFTPAVALDAAGNVQLVVTGLNGAIYHNTLTGTGWTGWDSPGGATPNGPAATFLSGLQLLVQGNDGTIYYNMFGTGWQSWSGLVLKSSLAPVILAVS